MAIAYRAIQNGYDALFTSAAGLIESLSAAAHKGGLTDALVRYTHPHVLVIDEVGYLPLSREEASLFFRLLTRRYEKASLILTSNKSFIDWGEIFHDQVLATAILDRLLHHATTLNIKGESYRLKEKRKAGILGSPPEPKEVIPQTTGSSGEDFSPGTAPNR